MRGLSKGILVIQGHPDASNRHFGHALADAYVQGARDAWCCSCRSETTYRVWRLYMAGRALEFEAGGTSIYQILAWSAPGYIEQVWNFEALSGVRIYGLPLEELLFGFSFGLAYTGIYEHFMWKRSVAG